MLFHSPSQPNFFFLSFFTFFPMKTGNDKPTQAEKKFGVGIRQTVGSLWSFEEPKKMRGRNLPGKVVFVLCIFCFIAGSLFNSRTWSHSPDVKKTAVVIKDTIEKKVEVTQDRDLKRNLVEGSGGDIMGEVRKTQKTLHLLDKTISTLEMELAVARTRKPMGNQLEKPTNHSVKKAFVVIGINTAFSSKKRRESLRETWMPTGDKLKKLEKEKGIVVRFVIGHSATPGGVLDRSIDEENKEYNDFLRLKHTEGYHELSMKTRIYFSTVVTMWDADFYMKVDDDIHLNLGMLATTLAKHKAKPRVYIGCMKSGPVLSQKGVKYHEPEFWKFGDEGNRYFRHATGQIYAISKDLATYISINWPILHRYANEDVTLGAWLFGLDVEHVNDHSLCCGTPPDCEWKAQAGNVCVASYDWACSGICRSVERMKSIHSSCSEGDEAVWKLDL